MRGLTVALGLAAGMMVAACSGDTALPIEAQCNPLGINNCMTPWPSAVFEVDDSTTSTSRKLAIPDHTLPTNFDGDAVAPAGWNKADGFSPSAPLVMAFPGGVSVDGLPQASDMTSSLMPESPTVILDMTTGTRVAHFAEIDMQADSTPDSQALFIRPSQRLIGGHRYAVAITTKVKARDGGELPVPPGFAAVLNGKHTDHSLLEMYRPRMKDVLDALETAGFESADLVVAWDFTVASDDFIHRDMIAARDRAVAALDAHPINFTITTDAPIDDGSQIKRKITGYLDAPLFLTNGGNNTVGTVIARDDQDLPALQGFYQIPYTATIPACAYTALAPVGMVLYGHGLMGTAEEVSYGVQRQTAAEDCLVMVATDMRGMSTPDFSAVATALNDATHADGVMEVLEQGIVNNVTLVRAMRTTFASSLFVDTAMANHSLVDPTKVYYYGLSQGAIFGTSIMAYEPTMQRAALGVGGANYSLLLDRSADWPQYRTILSGAYPDSLDDTMVMNLFQMRWDKVEGSGIVSTVLAGSPTSPIAKQILMQVALSDEQVPNLGSYWQARSMNIPVIGPTPVTPWGLEVAQSPLAAGASGILIMDGGAAAPPATNLPAPKVEPSMHDLTRTQAATRRQLKEFYATGTIINECKGVCTCQAGQCD